LYRESLLRDWEAKYRGSPILKEEALALTPMVLVMWKSRYEAFTAKCPTVSLRTINFAMRARGGWATIAGRPAWGSFKFGHTHPNQSNSGLMTLIMLACEFHGKKSGLTVSEIMSPQFQDYLTEFRAGVAGVSHSTGTLMKEMTLKGPTCYDALLVYENLAIEYAESAEGRWDALRVIYPEYNLWNENPYCILNTPWTTPEHQRAAEKFLAFLLSETVQTRALDFGFRPANPRVPVKGPNSPFEKYAKYGLTVDLATTCKVPSREVLENLQQSWIRCVPVRRDARR
jgi:ABC-type Fe3+ transport system substrate-binding protein